MTYTEKDLFRDAAAFGRRSGNKETTELVYQDVWKAVLKWIQSQFTIRKGACLSGMCTLTFTKTTKLSQERILRPMFVPVDSFVKANNLQWRGLTQGDNIKSEDINFAKIAIRFSGTLNKDTTFTCTRHMFAQIGKVLSTGTEVDINFGVGSLVARDRKVDFQFASEWARGLRIASDGASSSACGSVESRDQASMPAADAKATTYEGTRMKKPAKSVQKKSEQRKEAVGFGSRGGSRLRADSRRAVDYSANSKENLGGPQFVSFSGATLQSRPHVPHKTSEPPLQETTQCAADMQASHLNTSKNPIVPPRSSGGVSVASTRQAKFLQEQIEQTEVRKAKERAEEQRKDQEIANNLARLNAQANMTKLKLKQDKQDLAAYLKTQMVEKRAHDQSQRKLAGMENRPLMPAEQYTRSEVDLQMRKGQYRMELEDQVWEKQFNNYMEAEQARLDEEYLHHELEQAIIATQTTRQRQQKQQKEDLDDLMSRQTRRVR
eukprot:3436775-Pyramimonas_sp.AAC.2